MNKSNTKMPRTDITDADVLFEDNHLIAINKQAGDIVQVELADEK